MSLLSLPEPTHWPTGRRRLAWVTAAVAVFVTLGIGFGTRNLLRGDPLSAGVLVGMLPPFVLALIAVRRVARGRTTLCARVDSTGTRLRSDRTSGALLTIALAVWIPVGVVIAVATTTGDLELFSSTRGRVASIVLATSATIVAAVGLVSAWRRSGVGYVKLTPEGIEIADILRTNRVAWTQIIAVDDHTESKSTRKALVLKCSDDRESVIDGADYYVPHGAGLYWMVRHYRLHAEDRGELVDARAVQRLSDGRFEVE